MSNPKNCVVCGHQKQYHPDSKYLLIFEKPHKFVERPSARKHLGGRRRIRK